MERFLIFQLFGPLAAWGEVAVGMMRPSMPRPTRSAVIGLLAACLGLRRDQREELSSLASGLAIATELLMPGTNLRDYHTAQVPSEAEIRKARKSGLMVSTRQEALSLGNLNTILSKRDYRQDSLCRIAIHRSPDHDSPALETLRDALLKPRFTPYLGRKSCPPALPLAPKIVEAETLIKALNEEGPLFPASHEAFFTKMLRNQVISLSWDPSFPTGVKPQEEHQRRDDPNYSGSRLFRLRSEYVALLPPRNQ